MLSPLSRHEHSARAYMVRAYMVRGMQAEASESEQDWRLQARLDTADGRGVLAELVGHFRGAHVVEDLRASVAHDVVITHDGSLLFAYACSEAAISSARSAIEGALEREGTRASMRVSHWDDELDQWRQTDPPPSASEQISEQAVEREAEAPETRTLVASAGKEVRAQFEQSMRDWAAKLDLDCTIVEHPHLLRTQVAFTVTGPKRKIDEFAQGLKAETWATIRTETGVMLSPL